MRRSASLLLLLCGVACRGSACSDTPADDGTQTGRDIRLATDVLDPATVGEPYTAWLSIEGGTPPYRVALTGGSLPPGLHLNPAGAITGVPTQGGRAELTLRIDDAVGDGAAVVAQLPVGETGGVLGCGSTASGSLASQGVHDYGSWLDWEAEDGLQWLHIALPDEPISRIELDITSTGEDIGYAFLAPPGMEAGEHEAWELSYGSLFWGGGRVVVDLDSRPDLDTYRAVGQHIPVLLGAEGPMDWDVEVVCTDGPIITGRWPYPTALGDGLYVNHNVAGVQEGTTFSLEGALPEWASFDPASGKLTGAAETTGTWEYDVTAVAPDGRTRTEAGGFGVYEMVDLACGETAEFVPTDGYYAGTLNSWRDPAGWQLYRVPLDPETSALTLHASGVDGWLSVVEPAYGFRFYAGLHRSTFDTVGDARVDIDPATHPTLAAHRDADGAVYAIVHSYGATDTPIVLRAECETAPTPVFPALPVLSPGGTESHALEAEGGTPPRVWSAEGLPAGVTLAEDGTLSSDGVAAGSWPVQIGLVDAAGRSTTVETTLLSGADAACGDVPRLRCGDRVDVGFSTNWYADAARGSETWCIVEDQDDARQLTFHWEAAQDDAPLGLFLGAPGHGAAPIQSGDDDVRGDGSEAGRPGAFALREGGEVDLRAWQEGALFVGLRAYGATAATLSMGCE